MVAGDAVAGDESDVDEWDEGGARVRSMISWRLREAACVVESFDGRSWACGRGGTLCFCTLTDGPVNEPSLPATAVDTAATFLKVDRMSDPEAGETRGCVMRPDEIFTA